MVNKSLAKSLEEIFGDSNKSIHTLFKEALEGFEKCRERIDRMHAGVDVSTPLLPLIEAIIFW